MNRTQDVRAAKAWSKYLKQPPKRELKPQPMDPAREAEIEREIIYQLQDSYESR